MDIDAGTILSIISTLIVIAVGYGTLKQRRTEPQEKRWKELEAWRAATDAKLDHDNREIRTHNDKLTENTKFQQLILQSLKGIIDHLAQGNHGEDMTRISGEIDRFLIERQVR
ncbi:MAG: hypothetical protein LBT22_08900 [Peptococcaceae bacterium]|jgi:hypothetical protein|nr:hypothetical protein [Peptococcaceae bacterium]